MKIALYRYYNSEKINTSFSDGTRENGNRRFVEFLKELKKENIDCELYNKNNIKTYDLIIFCEIPNILRLFIFKIRNVFYKKKVILLIEESPVARPRHILLIPRLFDEVLLNSEIKGFKFRNYKTTCFSLASLPNKREIIKQKKFILNEERVNKVLYIGANKSALNKKSSYKTRIKFVRILSKYKDFFCLYGQNWERRQIPMDLPFLNIISKLKTINYIFNKFINISYLKIYSKGKLNSKIKTQNKYDFSLAIEPYLGHPISILEKIFDPMLSGSIPLYYGPVNISIPKGCYIRLDDQTNFEKKINILKNISHNEKKILRQNIYSFLISKQADRYRYSSFSKFLINKIKSYQ